MELAKNEGLEAQGRSTFLPLMAEAEAETRKSKEPILSLLKSCLFYQTDLNDQFNPRETWIDISFTVKRVS